MADAIGTLRAVLTPIAVVLACAIVVMLVVATFIGGLGFVVGTVADVLASPGSDAQPGTQAPSGTPAASFAIDGENGMATIEHVAGDAVDPERLVIGVDGESRGDWIEHAGTDDAVEEGDAVTVEDVEDGAEVTINWVSDEETQELQSERV